MSQPSPLLTEPRGHTARGGIERIIGTSGATARLRDTVRKVARSQAMTILLQGESGTGKDHHQGDSARPLCGVRPGGRSGRTGRAATAKN